MTKKEKQLIDLINKLISFIIETSHFDNQKLNAQYTALMKQANKLGVF